MKTYRLPYEENAQETKYQFRVPEGHNDHTRLDVYLTQFVQNATRNKVQQAIKEGQVWVNGVHEKASYKMQAGDMIDVILPKPPPPVAKAEAIPLDIVYEDEHLLVVNKPADMVVHPAFGNWNGTLVNGLLHHTNALAESENSLRPGIVHRIDKMTSGLLVVAKSEHVHAHLAEQFSTHSTDRTYIALVWGALHSPGTYEGNIGRSPKDRKKMAVRPESEGKAAITHYRPIQEFHHLTLMEITLETGRTHQIRVHFSHHGHPVFADPVYGGDTVRVGYSSGNERKRIESLISSFGRQALHAKTLGFIHPITQEKMIFDSDLPKDFQNLLTSFS